MNGTIARSAGFGAASLLAGLLFAGPALADGLPDRGKTRANDGHDHPCTVSANVGYTTEYMFRGISQTGKGDAAVQGGVDLTCGRFYVGTWGSSIAFGNGTEMDVYGGFRGKTGPINWDLGVIYYAYPGSASYLDLDYFEFKAAASGEIWKGGTLGGTVFFSPEYTGNTGEVWTLEGTFSQALPKVAIFSPTFSATLGNVRFQDEDFDYTYWNVGLTLGFREKWSLDLRYWDTDLNDYSCYGLTGSWSNLCDGRFVATLKYSF
jgi:uncharacterized protein (TIGR02001 family)